jgi:Protein of unknown function (DUF3800)
MTAVTRLVTRTRWNAWDASVEVGHRFGCRRRPGVFRVVVVTGVPWVRLVWEDQPVRLAYIDESYTRDFYFIGAVVVDDVSAPALERALDEVAARARSAYLPDVAAPVELHGNPLFQGSKEWAPVKRQIRALISVYEQAMKAIGSQDLHIFLRGLDCQRHRARYAVPRPEHSVVLQHMLERLDEFGQELGEQILVIADDIDDPDRHRMNLHDFRLTGTPGYRSSRLPNILDTLHFAPSRHSRLIQAADLVTFLHRRRSTIVETNVKQAQAIDRLWGHVTGRIRHQLISCP